MEKYDTGCTAGGGSNNMNVFYDAGLLFETNNGGTPYRTGDLLIFISLLVNYSGRLAKPSVVTY